MKIAVYTIALNEEQFVKRWYESAKDADYLLIADTGSTDKTKEIASSLGIEVYSISVAPWRFDDARNAALAIIPSDVDYCISLDMDEVLSENWREELEKINPNTTRPIHRLVTSFDKDGNPGVEFDALRMHSRHGHRWKYPIHESVAFYGIEEVRENVNIKILHYPDDNKSRGQYLPLLQMAAQEDPASDRCAHYYARELFYYFKYQEAANEFKRHLSLSSAFWKPERSESMRYLAKCEPELKEKWLREAISECPERREAFVDLAQHFYELTDWHKVKEYSELALNIKEKFLGYFCEADAWGWKPHDLLALANYNLGNYEEASKHGEIAVSLCDDQRLHDNLGFYHASWSPKESLVK